MLFAMPKKRGLFNKRLNSIDTILLFIVIGLTMPNFNNLRIFNDKLNGNAYMICYLSVNPESTSK